MLSPDPAREGIVVVVLRVVRQPDDGRARSADHEHPTCVSPASIRSMAAPRRHDPLRRRCGRQELGRALRPRQDHDQSRRQHVAQIGGDGAATLGLTHARERRLDQLFGAPLDAARPHAQPARRRAASLATFGAARAFARRARNFWASSADIPRRRSEARASILRSRAFDSRAFFVVAIGQRALQLFARVKQPAHDRAVRRRTDVASYIRISALEQLPPYHRGVILMREIEA